MIYSEVDGDPITTAKTLNDDLEQINLWSHKWIVDFSAKKTKTITFSNKRIKVNHPNLYLNNVKIKETDNHKHLGLILSQNGKWQDHLEYITEKAHKRLYILSNLRFNLDRNTLQTLYFSYVRPILEYGNVVWCNLNETQSNDLEQLQLKAARIVTGAVLRTRHDAINKELEWETLARRRENHKLFLLHKMVNKESPAYLSNLINIETNNHYNTRNRDNTTHITPIFAHTNLFYNSFVASSIRNWNNLKENEKSQSLHLFKNIFKQKPNVPEYFNYGSRSGQINIARLRMKCSNLNHHLCLRYLSDSAKCECGHDTEDIKHFLFECQEYRNIRNNTLSKLPYLLTVNICLHGDPKLSPSANKEICNTVISFINKTKRFIRKDDLE